MSRLFPRNINRLKNRLSDINTLEINRTRQFEQFEQKSKNGIGVFKCKTRKDQRWTKVNCMYKYKLEWCSLTWFASMSLMQYYLVPTFILTAFFAKICCIYAMNIMAFWHLSDFIFERPYISDIIFEEIEILFS